MKFHLSTGNQQGTTMLELIVVLAVLVIIIGTVVSIFISSIERQRYLLKEQEVVSQVNFAVEYMTRKIAEATIDKEGSCLGNDYKNHVYLLTDKDPVSGLYEGISFLSHDGACYTFYLDSDKTIKEVKTISTSATKTLLAGNFTIEYFRFILNGDKTIIAAKQGDATNLQPRVTTALNMRIPKNGTRKKIFQTTVSKRNFALESR